jgi:hypothetical protein
MKKGIFAAVFGLLALPTAASAAEAVPQACRDAASDTSFTQNKRRCYEDLSAHGRYQDVVDAIETQPIGLTPQEKYFLGAAYFGLSNRTAAQALKCVYSMRSKDFLDAFLTERQSMYRAQHSFGTSDDMKYVYQATKTLGTLKGVTGCEESSHTVSSLERYGRKYAAERIRGLFYQGSHDALGDAFHTKIEQMNNTTKEIVAIASQVETRFGLTVTEIDSGRKYLGTIRDKINAEFSAPRYGGEAIALLDNPAGDDRFPSFAWSSNVKTNVENDLDARTNVFLNMVKDTGEIGKVKAELLKFLSENSMDDYAAHKDAIILEIDKLSESLIMPINFGTELDKSPPRHWRQDLDAALAKPTNDPLAGGAIALDTMWRDGMKAKFCTDRNRWYCKGA